MVTTNKDQNIVGRFSGLNWIKFLSPSFLNSNPTFVCKIYASIVGLNIEPCGNLFILERSITQNYKLRGR
jgi:hypothetical protein